MSHVSQGTTYINLPLRPAGAICFAKASIDTADLPNPNGPQLDVRFHGAVKEAIFKDGFNNICELIRHERNALEIAITAEGAVTTQETAGVYGEDRSPSPLWMYTRQTELTEAGIRIKELGESVNSIPDRLSDSMH